MSTSHSQSSTPNSPLIPHGYKQTEVGIIPEDWEVSTFSGLFNITAGGDVDPKRSQSFQDAIHCYPIYSNALTNDGLYGYCSYANHPAGSITITARGMVGGANYRDHTYTAIGRVLVLQPKNALAGIYFEEVINNRVKFANESTGVPQLTAPQISKYRLPVPPLPEQRSIATVLSDVDALLESLDKLITKKLNLKQAAMQELLTGKTRLPGFSGEGEERSHKGSITKVAPILARQHYSDKTPKQLIEQIATLKKPYTLTRMCGDTCLCLLRSLARLTFLAGKYFFSCFIQPISFFIFSIKASGSNVLVR